MLCSIAQNCYNTTERHQNKYSQCNFINCQLKIAYVHDFGELQCCKVLNSKDDEEKSAFSTNNLLIIQLILVEASQLRNEKFLSLDFFIVFIFRYNKDQVILQKVLQM